MKNSLADLNGHLFAQLERLDVETLTPEQIDAEVKRTEAIVSLSKEVIANADLVLKGARLVAEHGKEIGTYLPMIGGNGS